MPDGNQPNAPLGDGAAAVQARLPATALLRPRPVAVDPNVAAARRYRRRVLLVLAGLLLALGLYWGSSYVFAYTDDAYVTSDLVGVAPWITGRIVAVPIVDNETVTKGTLLAEIDPTPFRLSLAQQVAKRVEAEAQLAVDHDLIKSAKAARDGAAAKEQMATDDLRRARPVAAAGFVSRQALEDAATQQQEAAAALADAEDTVVKARQTETLHEATVKAITAENRLSAMAARPDQGAGADRRHDHQPHAAGRRPGGGEPAADRPGRCPCLAHSGKLQRERDSPHAGRAQRLDLARRLSMAHSPRLYPRHCARHQPPADAQHAVALCRADHRLDSPRAAVSGDLSCCGTRIPRSPCTWVPMRAR